MSNKSDEFIKAAIAVLKGEAAQEKIKLALKEKGDRGQLSRIFDDFHPSAHLSKSFYKDTLKAAGKDALTIGFDDKNGQKILQNNINRQLKKLSKDLCKNFLSPNFTDISEEVKSGMGEANYLALEETYGKAQIFKYLTQAAIVSYSQALTTEQKVIFEQTEEKYGDNEEANNRLQDDKMAFGYNILSKFNEYPSIFLIDYIMESIELPLAKLEQQLERERAWPTKAKEKNLLLEDLDDSPEIPLLSKLEDAFKALKNLRDNLRQEISTIENCSTHERISKFDTAAVNYAKALSDIVDKQIKPTQELIELKTWFDKLLAVIYGWINVPYVSSLEKEISKFGLFSSNPKTAPGEQDNHLDEKNQPKN